MPIRAAREPDVDNLREIVERAYGTYIERIGRRPAPMDDDYAAKLRGSHVFVADDDGGEVIGFIVLITAPDHLLIENVAVNPECQGRGIGRSLLDFAEAFAARQQISELRLYTNVAMTENLALYSRLGYHEDERRIENGLKRVFLSKRISLSDIQAGPGNVLD